ncbi:STAS domain-containing protein [Exilibacterium tricleocarpae]|uniref:STAS domain-containing protein n=1 Tax=Exilibacterium tricleocarpae TaxID=2591008 RepID=A0A545U3X2_9GAMM|nr:STAS domain-containing protein [Exilibacterium tricleocarpae]TQV84172.1 STAS domain-containing protein [Exilibacterium tricleocarpae]
MEDQPAKTTLPENLTITNVEAVYGQLEELCQANRDIVLDGANVSRVDTAGLQVICALAAELKKSSLTLSWSNPSAELKETALILGMSELLLLK